MDCTSSSIMHIIEQFSLNLLCTCVKSSGTNMFFLQMKHSFLFSFQGRKLARRLMLNVNWLTRILKRNQLLLRTWPFLLMIQVMCRDSCCQLPVPSNNQHVLAVKAITISTIPQTPFNDYDSGMIRLTCEDDPFIHEEHHENSQFAKHPNAVKS